MSCMKGQCVSDACAKEVLRVKTVVCRTGLTRFASEGKPKSAVVPNPSLLLCLTLVCCCA